MPVPPLVVPSSLKEQQEALLMGLNECFQAQQLVDIVLVVQAREIKCHRVVLAASSRYFKAMFTCGLLEDCKKYVELYEVDADAVETLVNYMYTAQLNITHDNVQSIFSTANLFEMLSVCEMCSRYMVAQLNIANAVDIYQFASLHNCDSMLGASRDFVVNHFQKLLSLNELNRLSYEEFKDIIMDDDLNVPKEDTVFEAVVSWSEHDLESRLKFVSKLLQFIRFTLIDDEYITSQVMTNELVMNDSYFKTLVTNNQTFKLLGANIGAEKLYEETDMNAKPRMGMFNRKMMVFVGGSQDYRNRALTCFDPTDRKNYYAIPLHVNFDFKYRIDFHRIVVTESNEIYLSGGIFYEDHHFEVEGPSLDEFKVYNPHKIVWEERAPMLAQRCAHVLLYVQDHIYAIGGKGSYPGGASWDSVEYYNIEKDTWSYVSPMPARLCHHRGVVHEDSIIIMGGMDGNDGVSDCFLKYHIQTDTWISLTTTMNVARAEFGMAIHHNKIYIIGGTSGDVKLSSVEVFDTRSERWMYATDFPEDRKSMVTVILDDCIYVCGGTRTVISRHNRAHRVVETKDLWKYDPSTGYWTKEAKLIQYANIHACVVAEMNTRRLHQSDFLSHA